ncbi:hypothetical protein J3456_16835 [Sulfitobacter sp. NFXS29]|uniref:hypothetical protein n=1 Tax=Sulfitobacter sp. NFXS29 TaxID=2818438 RepID=UPI0032DF219F
MSYAVAAFVALRREDALVSPGAPDPLGPFKTKLYFNDWKSTFRFLTYTLFYRTDVQVTINCGANWIVSRPGKSAGPVAEKYLNSFCEIAGEKHLFSELHTRDRFAPWSFLQRLTCLVKFLSERSDLALYRRILFGAAHARFWDDERTLQKALSKLDARGLVTFCDQIGTENHIAQVAVRQGMKTVTLQHGQYRLLNAEGMSPDIEAIYNFVSETMLCWGEATIREFEKVGVSRNRFVPVGVISMDSVKESNLSPLRVQRSRRNAFGLALSGDNNLENNFELIEFARELQSETGMSCFVRIHPRSNINLYPSLAELAYTTSDTKENFIDLIDIAVMSSTGFFLDCYRLRCPFVFLDSRFLPEPFRASGVVVRGVNEVLGVLDRYDWDRLDELIPYNYNDTKARAQRINEVLNGPF